jgi:hypothetical protein
MTTTAAPEVTWAINWRGDTWTSADLTGRHAAAVAELLGVPPPWDWFDLSEVDPTEGPLQMMALIAAFVCVSQDVQGSAARRAVLAAVTDATLDELADAISV